jgi:hypothetical protein
MPWQPIFFMGLFSISPLMLLIASLKLILRLEVYSFEDKDLLKTFMNVYGRGANQVFWSALLLLKYLQ